MYIRNHMSPEPTSIGPDATIAEARAILAPRTFRHLPVVDSDRRLVGMLTDRDLRSALPSSVLSPEAREAHLAVLDAQPVRAIMSTTLSSLHLDSTLDDALYLFERQRVGALPVLDHEERLVGIFSDRDLLRAYKNLFGLGERGSCLVVVEDDGQPRPLTRIVQALEEYNINFTRLLRPITRPDSFSAALIYLRVNTFNITAVHRALSEAGFTPTLPRSTNQPQE